MQRGFSCIGLVRPKDKVNVAAVLRGADCYNSAFVAVEGGRNGCVKHGANTTQAQRHMPVFLTEDISTVLPYDTQIVIVDLIEGAIELPKFKHPQRAMYVFGPEDGTLGIKHTSKAQHVVQIPTSHCMNLAATVNVVLYDRLAKQAKN